MNDEQSPSKPWGMFIHVHVAPLGDTREHEMSEHCFCKPTPEWQERSNDGSYCIFVHHALDRRERREHLKLVD